MFIIFFIMLICAVIGGAMASGRGRNAILWAIICFFTGLIGIILLALMGSAAPATIPALAASPAAPQPATAPNKWATLVELDPDIAAAAAEARKYGTACENLLAEKYLALNDKQYLAAALEKAIEAFRDKAKTAS